MMSSTNRRRFLGGSLAVAAGAAVGSPLLSACSGPSAGGGPAPVDSTVQLPTYTPSEPVPPDLPPMPEGVLPGYFRYPENPVQQFDGPVGDGSTVELFTVIATGLPTPKADNGYWKAVEKGVGNTLNVNIIPPADYADKLATTIAGGDLPDILQIFQPPPRLPQLLEAEFADLTEYLSADAVKDFPNLAAIPTQSWRACVFNSGIYAVPIPRALVGPIVFRRDDLLEKAGVASEPANYAEWIEQAKAVTTDERWAFGQTLISVAIQEMLGVPNGWKEENGVFTAAVAVPERKEVLARMLELLDAGLFHPETLLPASTDITQLFVTDKVVWEYSNYSAWPEFYLRYGNANPAMDVGGMIPPPFETGVQPTLWQGGGYFAYNALKKADPDRIRQLLTVMNWFAAPFGTKEYLLETYGVEGTHYEMKDGAPVPLKAGATETLVPFHYLADGPEVLYQPGREDVTRKQHAYQVQAMPQTVPNAATGLYSPTAGQKTAPLNQIITEAETEILNKRQPLNSWDEAVTRWKSEGGDEIKAEYEEAFAATR